MTTKAVIFDADGMIVLHVPRFSSVLEKERGIPLERTKLFFEGPFQLCLVGKADLREELSKVIGQWGWQDTVDDLMEFWFSPALAPIDTRFEGLIRQLRATGVKTYLATNNEKYRTKNLIEERGLGAWFDGVFSSSHVGAKKRSAEFLEYLLKSTKHRKEEVEYWDDDPKNIEGVKAFGLSTHLYTDFDSFKDFVDTLLVSEK